MKESIETEHFYYSGETEEGNFMLNGAMISFNRIIVNQPDKQLTLELGYKNVCKVNLEIHDIMDEVDKIKTFIANYQYCYK